MKAGALGTHNSLGLAKAHGAKFLLTSTSEVYGNPLVHPQKESYWGNVDPVGVRSVYDEAKRFAEALTMAYHNFHGVDTRIVRIFNTFGPGMRLEDGRAVPNFIQQALRHEPLTIYGSGEQTRSFCYVDDLIDDIRRLMDSDEHQPVNIGLAQLRALYIKAKTAIPPKVDYYAAIIGVSYGRISIRNQTSRWGSCSSKGNLNFNCKLMLLDDELIDYVVVHELCHRLQMNHSPAFWAEVERIIPDYRLRRKRLKESGAL